MSQYTVEAVLKATGVDKFAKAFDTANKQIVGFKKNAEQIGKSMKQTGDSLQKFGKGLTKSVTLPVAAAVGASIKSFADLEQAVGGIETMFEKTAGTVIKNSETAYKRAGVSGVDYMENVTSFSATLLQGLGGDTEKAAKLADTAMVDMSDNANKFGTNIKSVQDAYQGFAKDNFTMLDNLKLGYGGTAGEMARLINDSGVLGDTMEVTAETLNEVSFATMIEAIHEIQNEMGVTGTTAKEAEETVSGSFGMLKASIQDLSAGFGEEGANIEQLMKNVADSVVVFVGNIKRVLGDMWDNLPLTDFQKWAGLIVVAAGPVLTVLGSLLSSAGSLAIAVGKAGSLMGGLSSLFPGLSAGLGLVKGAFGALLGSVGLVIVSIGVLVAALVYFYNTNETVREVVDAVWAKIKSVITTVINAVSGVVTSVWGTLTSFWVSNNELIRSTATTVWNAIKAVITTAVNTIKPLVIGAWNAISIVTSGVWNTIKVIIDGAMNAILGIIKTIMQIITGDWSGAWNTMKGVVSGVISSVISTIKSLGNISLLDAGKAIINGFVRGLKSAWEAGKKFVSGIGGWIRDNKGPISYDKKLLIDAGEAIIGGLNKGLQDSFVDVQKTIGGMAGAINQTMFNGPSVNINGTLARSNFDMARMNGRVEHHLAENHHREPVIHVHNSLNVGGYEFSQFVETIDVQMGRQIALNERFS